eukprot:TRINITY_DN100879_c0_g1_i1.p1 TRINITY_DN100879_c0_g1~~TRINITY_DN100879_c0_g1_i1.p1  ORF type:complete len:1263 (-),score=318.34 TRINITY_DN100879_c0_g1_i1:269-4057(-)
MGEQAAFDLSAFPARDVEFTITIRAIFNKAVGKACVTLPWIDDSVINSGPLAEFEADALSEDVNVNRRRFPNMVRATCTRVLPRAPVTMDLVRKLQKGCLPISVFPSGDDTADPARGAARVHLAPLLMANSEEPDEAEPRDKALRIQPCKVAASWMETVAVAGLASLELFISTDVPVLGPQMMQKLMPLCLTLEMVRNLPGNSETIAKEFEDVFVEVYPRASPTTESLAAECPRTRSNARPHARDIRFNEPIVWLLGLAPLHSVREWMSHHGVVIEIHDRDCIEKPPVPKGRKKKSDEDEDEEEAEEASEEGSSAAKERTPVVFPHGLAHFSLLPLLKSRSLVLPLSSTVAPSRGSKKLRKLEVGLAVPMDAEDLLTPEGMQDVAERTAEGKREDTTDYHKRGVVCTLKAVLATSIPPASAQQGEEERQDQENWAASEQLVEEGSNIYQAAIPEDVEISSPKPYRAKLAATVAGGEEIIGPWRKHRADAEKDATKLSETLAEAGEEGASDEVDQKARELASTFPTAAELKNGMNGIHRRYEKYGRAVVMLKDQDTETMKRIIKHVRLRNCETLGLDPAGTALEVYELSEKDVADAHLDVLMGFVVMDSTHRFVIIEGLRDGGLRDIIDQAVPRNERRNGDGFKLLFNPEIGYKERLYMGFKTPLLKTVKLRDRLSPIDTLASKADLYAYNGKPSPRTSAGMQAPTLLMELKRIKWASELRDGHQFPSVENIMNLENLYGGTLSAEEIAGEPSGTGHIDEYSMKRGRLDHDHSCSAAALQRELLDPLSPGAASQATTVKPLTKATRKPGLDMTNTNYDSTRDLAKSQSAPNFIKMNKTSVLEKSQENVKAHDAAGRVRHRETPFLDGHEVHLYSSQKFCSVELQKEYMRKQMDPQQADRSWTYDPTYLSCTFEFSGADPPGVRKHQPSKPADTYSRLAGDERPVFRPIHSRRKEDFRMPDRVLGHGRADELHEAFVENEHFQLAVGVERHLPLATHVRFEPDKVPHRRVVSEKPFDASRIMLKGKDFGPRQQFESVHMRGEGKLPEQRNADITRKNVEAREKHDAKRIQAYTHKTFSQGATRQCITDLDRREVLLKDPPNTLDRFASDAPPLPAPSMAQTEVWHERGRPDLEFAGRMRENDSSPPYDVMHGTYMRRDPEIGMKRACMSGTLGKAPWKHGGSKGDLTSKPKGGLPGSKLHNTQAMNAVTYMSNSDFNLTRPPQQRKNAEAQIFKSASRSSLTKSDRKHQGYRRPADYGVAIQAL